MLPFASTCTTFGASIHPCRRRSAPSERGCATSCTIEGRAHEFRSLGAEEPQGHALEAIDAGHHGAQVKRVPRERHLADHRVAFGHDGARRPQVECVALHAQHAMARRVAMGQEVEIVLPSQDREDLVVGADELAPVGARVGKVALLRDVHGDLAPRAVARDRVCIARFGRNMQGRHDEFGNVARATDTGREHHLVVGGIASEHMAVHANVRVTPRAAPALGYARVVEGLPVRIPCEIRIEARAVDLERQVARGPRRKHAQHRVLAPRERHAVRNVKPVGRGHEPVDRGRTRSASEALRIEQHALRAEQALAHAKHGRLIARGEPQVEDARAVGDHERGDRGGRFRQRANAGKHAGAAGNLVERGARPGALVPVESLGLGARRILEDAERVVRAGDRVLRGRCAERHAQEDCACQCLDSHGAVTVNWSAASRA
jgi:hypothetical protein